MAIHEIKPEGQCNITQFIIQGLTLVPAFQLPMFLFFLFTYIIILLGNITIFVAILGNVHLHTPMYFFLMNLSVIDVTFTSNILPKLIYMLLFRKKTTSFLGCIIQMYYFMSMVCVEVLLLGTMAYDRYVAICHPLHYFILMSLKKCTILVMILWAVGLIDPVGHAKLVYNLCFCASHNIDHFFCDLNPLLKLSCSDTFLVETLNYIEGSLLGFSTFILTLISYVFIISTVLRIKSVEGRKKAFSTCSSHLTCVSIFYGSILCLYMRPTSSYSPKQDKYFALLNVVLVPALNPLIYTLKNQEVKDALKKLKKDLTC